MNFEVMLQKLGTTPEETLFIDDSLNCVESAKAFGLDAIRFEGVDQLRKALNA